MRVTFTGIIIGLCFASVAACGGSSGGVTPQPGGTVEFRIGELL